VTKEYPSQIKTADILPADVTLGAVGVPTLIGKLTVSSGTAISLGVGDQEGQDNAEGRLYVDIVDDTAAAEDGMLRFEARDPNETETYILYDLSTIKGRAGDADTRAAQVPFKAQNFWIPENWSIQCWMRPDAAGDVVDVSASTFLADCMKATYRAA
jgi:hypothetical protein